MDMDEIIRSRCGSGKRRRRRLLASITAAPILTMASSSTNSSVSFPLIFIVAVYSLVSFYFIPSTDSFLVPSSSFTSLNGNQIRKNNAKTIMLDNHSHNQEEYDDDENDDTLSKLMEIRKTNKKIVVSTSTKGQVEQLQRHHNQRKKQQQQKKQKQQRKQQPQFKPQQLQSRNHDPPIRHNTVTSGSSNNSSSNYCTSNSKNSNNKTTPTQRRPQRQRQQRRRRCSTIQDEKRHVRHLYSKARSLEKMGSWNESSQILYSIINKYDPYDAHSYLALARLEGRRERTGTRQLQQPQQHQQQHLQQQLLLQRTIGSEDTSGMVVVNEREGTIVSDENGENDDTILTTSTTTSTTARQIFQKGTTNCPHSIHLWHAWAMHEMSRGNISLARTLFEEALALDPQNGYVCHAYGMLEMQEWHTRDSGSSDGDDNYTQHSSREKAEQLWKQGMEHQPSAALVTSLGQLYISTDRPTLARQLYASSIPRLDSDRERAEVYMASASLEEHVFRDAISASKLLKAAVSSEDGRMQDSRAFVALARLGAVLEKSSGSKGGRTNDLVVKERLKEICMMQWREVQRHKRQGTGMQQQRHQKSGGGGTVTFQVKDGRLFNAWAKLESKRNLGEARRILRMGIKLFPNDHTLLQAAGNIEERRGNFTAARDRYSASLHIKLSAPALIAYALLELRSPEDETKGPNIAMVRKLFHEALLIDPKHGPVYNAFGNLERRQGNIDAAKQLYEDGINANCTDAPSVYHGLAKLYLSLGEVEEARSVLQRGLALYGGGSDNSSNNVSLLGKNANVAFLSHTLALIELNCNNNPTRAKSVLEQGLWHCDTSSQLLLAMALCESRLGNDAAARTMFEKSLMADQCHAQAWQAFGMLEMRAGNFKSAKTLFECGLKNSPTHGALWQAYGTLESWKGNVSEARLLFAAGIAKCPRHVPLYQAWACLELRSGDVLTAKRLIGEALTRNKRNGSGWLVAAKIEEKMGNTGLVGLILRRGIECAPGNPELYRALAEHEISRRQIDSARELLEKGIELNPLYAPLYHSLAELEARVFNIDGLAKLNRRLATIFPSDANAHSSQQTTQAWGKKIKLQHSSTSLSGKILPDSIAALAQQIGVDGDAPPIGGVGSSLVEDDLDPETLLNSICGFGGSSDDEDAMMFQDVPYGEKAGDNIEQDTS